MVKYLHQTQYQQMQMQLLLRRGRDRPDQVLQLKFSDVGLLSQQIGR